MVCDGHLEPWMEFVGASKTSIVFGSFDDQYLLILLCKITCANQTIVSGTNDDSIVLTHIITTGEIRSEGIVVIAAGPLSLHAKVPITFNQ